MALIDELDKVKDKLFNRKTLTDMVERLVDEEEIDYFSAILHICEYVDREPEDVLKYCEPALLEKIKYAAIRGGYRSNPDEEPPAELEGI